MSCSVQLKLWKSSVLGGEGKQAISETGMISRSVHGERNMNMHAHTHTHHLAALDQDVVRGPCLIHK